MSDVVAEEGVYDGIPDDVYHSDKNSLSSSGARTLLESPAKFHHGLTHPRPPAKHFDFGHAAHALVLGVGAEFVQIDADEWRTKAVKDEVAAVRAEGKVPLKPADYTAVHDMAAALRAHPKAAPLFTEGQAEQSMYWQDEDTGAWLRSRPDWLHTTPSGRMVITDYKTTSDAHPRRFSKSAADYGYHRQHPWYTDALVELGLDDDPGFVFVAQEKTAPYLVSVVELDLDAIAEGRALNRQAINLYANCRATGVWPTWSDVRDDVVHRISLPAYAFK